MIDPQEIQVFTTCRAAARRECLAVGTRFLNGFMVPDEKAQGLLDRLGDIEQTFNQERDRFLTKFDRLVEDWVAAHPAWEKLLRDSGVTRAFVAERLAFAVQAFKIVTPGSVTHPGLAEATAGLADNLLTEVAQLARDTLEKSYLGKTAVTRRPLLALQQKLDGLAFLDRRVRPIVQSIEETLMALPRKGTIQDRDLQALIGLLSILEDPQRLKAHGEELLTQAGDEASRALVNILEDIRIEQALGQALPGSRHNLNRLVTHLVEQGDFWQVPDAQAHPAKQVQAYLLFRLRANLLNQTAMQPLADQAEAVLRQTLPSGVMTRLSALAFEVGKTSSTGEIRELAKRILQMLAEEQREIKEERQMQANQQAGASPSTPGSSVLEDIEDTGDATGHEGDKPDELDGGNPDIQDSGPGGQSSDDEGSSPSAAGSPENQEDSRNPSAEATSAEAEDDDPDTTLNGNPVADPEPVADRDNGKSGGDTPGQTGGRAAGTEPDSEVLHQLLNADVGVVDATLGDLGQQLAVRLNRAAGDPDRVPVMAEFDPLPRALDSAMLSQRVRTASVALRRRLTGLVEAERRDDVRRVRQGRHLACRQLYRLGCRESGIFERKTRRPAPDTAVYVLLDRSGSMAGTPLQVASEATLAMALALEEIPGCQTAVLAFPGSSGKRVIPLLDFAERASPVAGRFRLLAQGTTPMASALWRAAYGLLCRPEARRLLIVITDGEPDQLQATEDIIHRCRQTGIEVYGLGIGLGEPVKTLFGVSRAVSITEIEALPAALFCVLERALLAA